MEEIINEELELITDEDLSADFVDGEVLTHTDLNKIIDVFKTAINYNYAKLSNPGELLKTLPGYDSSKVQVLKHINGVMTWVEE